MPTTGKSQLLDRYTEIGQLSDKVRKAIERIILPLTAAVVVESGFLLSTGRPGAVAGAEMGIGACGTLHSWSQRAIGLPLPPMMAGQCHRIYGTALVVGHDGI